MWRVHLWLVAAPAPMAGSVSQFSRAPPLENSSTGGTVASYQSDACVGSSPIPLSLYIVKTRPPSWMATNSRRGEVTSSSGSLFLNTGGSGGEGARGRGGASRCECEQGCKQRWHPNQGGSVVGYGPAGLQISAEFPAEDAKP